MQQVIHGWPTRKNYLAVRAAVWCRLARGHSQPSGPARGLEKRGMLPFRNVCV